MKSRFSKHLGDECSRYLTLYHLVLKYVEGRRIDLTESLMVKRETAVESVFRAFFNVEPTTSEMIFMQTIKEQIPPNEVFALVALMHRNLTSFSWNELLCCALEIDYFAAQWAPELYEFYHNLHTLGQSFHFSIPFLRSACVGIIKTADIPDCLEIILEATSGFEDLEFLSYLLFRVYDVRFLNGIRDESVFIFDRISMPYEFVCEVRNDFDQCIHRHKSCQGLLPAIEDPLGREKLILLHEENFALLDSLNSVIRSLQVSAPNYIELFDQLKGIQFVAEGKCPFKTPDYVEIEATNCVESISWVLGFNSIH